VQVNELRLKTSNSLLFDADEVGDVIEANEIVLVVLPAPSSSPAAGANDTKAGTALAGANDTKAGSSSDSKDESDKQEESKDKDNDEEGEFGGAQNLRPTRVVGADYTPPDTLLFPSSDETIQLVYQTSLSTNVENLNLSLSTTLTTFKEMIATKAGLDTVRLASK